MPATCWVMRENKNLSMNIANLSHNITLHWQYNKVYGDLSAAVRVLVHGTDCTTNLQRYLMYQLWKEGKVPSEARVPYQNFGQGTAQGVAGFQERVQAHQITCHSGFWFFLPHGLSFVELILPSLARNRSFSVLFLIRALRLVLLLLPPKVHSTLIRLRFRNVWCMLNAF